jgi:hypothetical protein
MLRKFSLRALPSQALKTPARSTTFNLTQRLNAYSTKTLKGEQSVQQRGENVEIKCSTRMALPQECTHPHVTAPYKNLNQQGQKEAEIDSPLVEYWRPGNR